MKTLTKSVSRDLAYFMVGFGILVGIIFPFFTVWLVDVPEQKVLRPGFFAMCITAGILVGLVNFAIFKWIVASFLQRMNNKILDFRGKLRSYYEEGTVACRASECHLDVTSADIVGSLSQEFNTFIDDIASFIEFEKTTERFLKKLERSLKINEVAKIIIETFLEYFGGDGAFLLGLERGQFVLLESHRVKIDLDKIGPDYWFSLLAEGRPDLLTEVANDSIHFDIGIGTLDPRHIVLIPLKYQAENVGVCGLLSRRPFQKSFFTVESRNFINQSSPFLHNAMLMKRLEILAAIDELTGALNRRFGLKRLTEEFERSQRHQIPLSIAMVDIDHFKNINDTYGHQAGDFILRMMAEMITQSLRVSDIVIRYGGEEFLVAFFGASAVDCHKILERIRKQAETMKFQYGSFELRLTFSGGIASFPSATVSDLNGLIQQADAALYKAKQTGRNRIVIGA